MEKITLSDYGYDCLQIETASACNMACTFCPYPLKEDKQTKLPAHEIKNIIDQVDPKDPKFRHIDFSLFNEPLLDSRVFEVVE
jgi:MoaA/NifB/PqqE/SkfB family radical SAM enzyme